MARSSLSSGADFNESDAAVTKLLQISALSLTTLFFAACDPEMVDSDVQERALHGVMLDLEDSDGADDDDGGFEIRDDFSDAEPMPAPMVEYDLVDAEEGEEEDEDQDGDLDAELPLADGDGDGDDGWGDFDLEVNDDADDGDGSVFEPNDWLRADEEDEEDEDIGDLAGF